MTAKALRCFPNRVDTWMSRIESFTGMEMQYQLRSKRANSNCYWRFPWKRAGKSVIAYYPKHI